MKDDSHPTGARGRSAPVLVPMPAERPYTYAVPDDMQVVPGSIVRVPLGPREVAGVVWDAETNPVDPKKLKPISEVFDCPPIDDGSYTNLLPEAADGIVLVIQAEKTRPVVVARARDLVQQAGGQVLGAVLNRRTNYIPDFLYKLL